MNIPDEYKPISHIVYSLNSYEATGRPVGGFLLAVLENNLFKAVERADLDNRRKLPLIVQYIYNNLDHSCYGSPEAVENYRKGMRVYSN